MPTPLFGAPHHRLPVRPQASRLANNKMSAYWDLLSLQDPRAKPGATKRPKAYALSIKEYELVEPIGTGGFGTVWLARRRRTGDLSAIKVLSQADTRQRKMNASVLFEKRILQLADHPCVVQLLFSFSTPRNIYMVMEYLPGGDCFTLLQSFGFLEEDLARCFCAEALLGLQYLHGCAVIHRDVKPSNMLITDKGHIKLADFGLSTADDRDDELPPIGEGEEPTGKVTGRSLLHLPRSAVGTPDYLAPELLARRGYSYEVDFWALGVVLYQFLVGEPPFSAEEIQDTYQRILDNSYERHPDDMSAEADDLISVLLVTNPEKRLGGGEKGVPVILEHAFFAPISPFDSPPLPERQSPYTPTLKHKTDTSNFDMNALQKAQAELMRSQLERDHDENESFARAAVERLQRQAAGGAGAGTGAGAGGGAGGAGAGAARDGAARDGGGGGAARGGDEDDPASEDSNSTDDDMSFKTVNATMVARMQLHDEEDDEEATQEATATPK